MKNYEQFKQRWISAIMKTEGICREQAEMEFDEFIEDMMSDINDDIDSDNENDFEINDREVVDYIENRYPL